MNFRNYLKKITLKQIALSVLLPLGILIAVVLLMLWLYNKLTQDLKKDDAIRYVFDDVLDPNIIDIIVAQSKFETGNYISRAYLEDHNMFGMKLPTQRKTTAIGKDKSGYAVYNGDVESAIDFKYYLLNRTGGNLSMLNDFDIVGYVTWLHSNSYFEAPLTMYITGVTNYYNKSI